MSDLDLLPEQVAATRVECLKLAVRAAEELRLENGASILETARKWAAFVEGGDQPTAEPADPVREHVAAEADVQLVGGAGVTTFKEWAGDTVRVVKRIATVTRDPWSPTE